ncbi:hypothetical protein EK21DRAFT_88214 [Setomelanomma holmii]|uniref:F-box domain-containing protein n=1 Tax=Setomelanomma holmii TaxID=210430 RepID=A0A9P4LLA2_9PLEO|nr:hypothetical protein EK21DRAFT_88214 [Setomelanomma holmii]
MSLSKLPTELDLMIANCLDPEYSDDRQTLIALSKVSKRYQIVAEERLYRDITFSDQDSHALQCLFMCVLNRPELALNIKYLSLDDGLPSSKTGGQIWDHAPKIQDMLTTVLQSCQRLEALDLSQDWFHRFFNGNGNEAAVALIVGLAKNLEGLSFVKHQMNATMRLFLSLPWSTVDGPLPKLKVVHASCKVCNELAMPFFAIPPSMTTLRIENYSFSPHSQDLANFSRPLLSSGPSILPLRTLDFDNMDIHDVRTSSASYWDFRGLLDAIQKDLPLLDEFEWSFQRSRTMNFDSPFRTFKNLERLRTLSLDWNLLVPREEQDLYILHKLAAVLPPSLEFLTLDFVTPSALDDTIVYIENMLAGRKKDELALRHALEQLSAILPNVSKDLTLNVCMVNQHVRFDGSVKRWRGALPSTLSFLQPIADILIEQGLKLVVRNVDHCGHFTDDRLVEAGFTQKAPYSLSYDTAAGAAHCTQHHLSRWTSPACSTCSNQLVHW